MAGIKDVLKPCACGCGGQTRAMWCRGHDPTSDDTRHKLSLSVRDRVGDLTGRRIGRLVVKSGPVRIGSYWCWQCMCDCGATATVRTARLGGRKPTRSCGCLRRELSSERMSGLIGPSNRRWKGGRHITREGYVELRVPGHHNATKNGNVREHRLVMERHLGRRLKAGETVHHKNGKRDDNRLDNLELWTHRHTPGQRVEDLIDFAVEVLSEYRPDLLSNVAVRKAKASA